MQPEVDQHPRYMSLRDYVRVIRTNRLLIAVTALIFAGAALAFSLSQEKSYTANSTLEFRDVIQDLNLIGANSNVVSAPSQLAAVNSKLVDRPAVAARVKEDLGIDLSVKTIQSSISTSVGSQTNLVTLSASAVSPELAAGLANSFARQTRLIGTHQTRKQLDKAIRSLNRSGANTPDFNATIVGQLVTQLQAARAIAEPVRVIERAEPPNAPSSPKTWRNTLLGLLVGLTLGTAVAFIRDSMDRRLRAPQAAQEELGMPVLGKVSEDALGHVGFGANGSAAVSDHDLESFRILRANLEFLREDRPLRSLLVTSGLPEEGKSTVAASLACTATLAGRRTLLVECDVRHPSLASRLGLSPKPGLTDFLLGSAEPHEILQTVDLAEPMNFQNGRTSGTGSDAGTSGEGVRKLVCITAGSPASHPAELLGSERFRDFLEKVTEVYEVVVIDSSPLLSVVDPLEVAREVDGVIVCVRMAQTTREQARAVQAALKRVPDRPMGAVVTGMKPGDDEAYGGYYHSYGGQ